MCVASGGVYSEGLHTFGGGMFTAFRLTSLVTGLWVGPRSSVVSASEFKPDDPGFDPQVAQGEGQFLHLSQSTLVQTCVPDLPSCVRHAPRFVRLLVGWLVVF